MSSRYDVRVRCCEAEGERSNSKVEARVRRALSGPPTVRPLSEDEEEEEDVEMVERVVRVAWVDAGSDWGLGRI
jgi:hypothetical protein